MENTELENKYYRLYIDGNIVSQTNKIQVLETLLTEKIQKLCFENMVIYNTDIEIVEKNKVNIIGWYKNSPTSYQKILHTLKIIPV